MKWLLVLMGLVMTTTVVIALVMVELLIKLAPLIVLAAITWAVVAAVRGRTARRAAGPVIDEHPDSPWIPTSTPTAPVGPLRDPAPPLPVHRDRVYLVRGEDVSLATTGRGLPLKVVTAAVPAEIPRHPHPPLRYLKRHRRSTRKSSRP